jgi:predicted transposase/invertase (TIGR01784 family)
MDTAIAKAQEKIMRVSSSKEALRAYQMREMALSDYTSGINYAREEGKQEGKREGRQEASLEILNLLKAGKSVEEISRLFHVD